MRILFPVAEPYRIKEIEFIRNDFLILKELGHDVKTVVTPHLRNLFLALLKEKYDIVFSWFVGRGFPPTLLKRRGIIVAGGGDVCTERSIRYGYEFLPLYRKLMIRYTVKYAPLILAVSKHAKDNIIKLGGKNVKVLYLGVKTDEYKPNPALREENRLLIISTLSRWNVKRKNFVDILKALVYLKQENQNIKLIIFGRKLDGFPLLLRMVKLFRLDKCVEFPKKTSKQQKIEELQKASVFLHPSYHEAFGLAIAEAMSCEIPVVVSRKGSIPEIVGNCGFYVPLKKPKILATKILELLEDKKLAKKLGKRGRKRIIELFSYEHRKKGIQKVLSTF